MEGWPGICAYVDKMNEILLKEIERFKHVQNLIIWDSFDKLMER